MTLRIFGSTFSPFVRKVVAMATAKGLDFEVVNIRIQDADPDFRRASPLGKMPAIIDGDYRLADSSAIAHYLDAAYPDVRMIPDDPQAKGRAIWFEEYADTVLGAAAGKIFFNRIVAPIFLNRDGDLEVAAAAVENEIPALFDYLEGAVAGREWLVGDRMTLADIAVASVLANLEHGGAVVDPARWPDAARWVAKMHALPCFADMVTREKAFLAKALAPK